MSEVAINWLPAIVVLGVALLAGAIFAVRAMKKPSRSGERTAELEDLEARKEALMTELRELKTARDKMDATAYEERRRHLEAEAARALAARDKLAAKLASSGTSRAAATPAAAKPLQLAGFIYGAGTVAVLWFLWSLVSSHGKPEAVEAPPHPPGMSTGAMSGELGELVGRLHQNPDDFEALVQVAHLLIRQMRIAQAGPIVERALQIDPKHAESRVHMAMVTAANGDNKSALAQLDAVAQEHPTEAEAWFFRGMIGLQTGDLRLKNESFARYLELSPEGPQKERVRAMLAGDGAPNGDRGATLWAQECASCHGTSGQGDGPNGKNLALPDMASAPWQAKLSDEQMRKAITGGVVRNDAGRVRRMPAFPFAQADIDALVKHVRSLAQ